MSAAPPLGSILPILDVGPLLPAERLAAVTRALLAAGATWVQLRAKHASARELLEHARLVRALTREHGASFVVNDRPDVAVLAEADGVHLGQDDLPARAVRRWLPPHMFLGVSTHSPAQVQAVVNEGLARYVGFGPVYPTGSKLDPDPVVGLDALAAITRAHPTLHVVAIGGVSELRAAAVAAAGAGSAAMISALLTSADPGEALRRARAAFERGRAREPADATPPEAP